MTKLIIGIIIVLVIGNFVWMFGFTKSYCKVAMFSNIGSVPVICLKSLLD